jgi:hypothetical protein
LSFKYLLQSTNYMTRAMPRVAPGRSGDTEYG